MNLLIWINVMASLAVLIAALRLYQVHHSAMPLATRMFFAAVACAALWSVFEILAWRQPDFAEGRDHVLMGLGCSA